MILKGIPSDLAILGFRNNLDATPFRVASTILAPVIPDLPKRNPGLELANAFSVMPCLFEAFDPRVAKGQPGWNCEGFQRNSISRCPFHVLARERALREDVDQHKCKEYDKPSVDRKAGVDIKRMRWSRNGIGDRTDYEAENLQCEQHPGDRLHP